MNTDCFLNHYAKETPVFMLSGNPIYREQFVCDILQLKNRIARAEIPSYHLCFNHSYWFSVALFAVLAAGKEPILLPNHQADTLIAFKQTTIGMLSDIDGITSSLPIKTVDEEESMQLAGNGLCDALPRSLSQTVTLYTSGSTGNSKKIQRTLKEIIYEAQALSSTFKDEPQPETVYSSVSPQHIYGLMFYIFWPLLTGKTIAYPRVIFPEEIEKLLKCEQKKTLVSCPSLLSRLAFSLEKKTAHRVFSSGNLLKEQAAQWLHQNLHLEPIEVLGSTETGGIAFRQQMLSKLWKPLENVKITQDEHNQCLLVDSPFFSGEKPFLTADQIELDADGLFTLVGRVDRIVKVEGKRVSLDAVENHIKSHELISDAALFFVDDKFQFLAAVIVLNEAGALLLKTKNKHYLDREIKAWHARLFDLITRPKKIRYVSQIPVNSQGKILHQSLKKIIG